MITDDGRVVHEVRFEHPVARVWDAIVDPDALTRWLMPNDFEATVGHQFHFDAGPPRGLIASEVVELVPPRRIVLRWTLDDVPTTVTIDLRPDGEGTLLHLEHADLPSDPRPKFDTGWVDKLGDLDALLEGRA